MSSPSGSGMVRRLFSHAAAAGTTPWLPASASHSCLAGSCAQPQSQAAYGARPPCLAGDPACLRSRRASALVLLLSIGQACWPNSGNPSQAAIYRYSHELLHFLPLLLLHFNPPAPLDCCRLSFSGAWPEE